MPSPPSAPLGIRKRKPRSSSVISAANQRAKGLPKLHPLPVATPASISPSTTALNPSPHPISSSQETVTSVIPTRSSFSESKRKGLRHFAIRVCKKVEQKGTTTYNEVADELVAEERLHKQRKAASSHVYSAKELNVDEKNIRRRVYDSLNVLMAMRIIAREKKLITWQGLAMAQSPDNSEKLSSLRDQIHNITSSVEQKRALLAEVQEEYRRTAAIVERNRMDFELNGGLQPYDPVLSKSMIPSSVPRTECLNIPFIIVSAPKDTNIELEMNESREDICFTFDSAFVMMDDREILKRMPLSANTPFFPVDTSTPPTPSDDIDRLRVTHQVPDVILNSP